MRPYSAKFRPDPLAARLRPLTRHVQPCWARGPGADMPWLPRRFWLAVAAAVVVVLAVVL